MSDIDFDSFDGDVLITIKGKIVKADSYINHDELLLESGIDSGWSNYLKKDSITKIEKIEEPIIPWDAVWIPGDAVFTRWGGKWLRTDTTNSDKTVDDTLRVERELKRGRAVWLVRNGKVVGVPSLRDELEGLKRKLASTQKDLDYWKGRYYGWRPQGPLTYPTRYPDTNPGSLPKVVC